MIYTVTLNPSLDYIVSASHFALGKVNRVEREMIFPGGKGINVSIVLKNLGLESRILGFAAGFSGEEIRRRLKEIGCAEELLTLPGGYSRINIKLRAGQETELNGQGPVIDEKSTAALYEKLDGLEKGDVLVLAGSIPPSMQDSVYRDILKKLEGKGIMAVVDGEKDLLLQALPYRPFLIKPNNYELGEIFGTVLTEREAIICCARKLQQEGARNVLVSMGAAGAILVAENGAVYIGTAPKGRAVNSVGAGDSMTAGFLYGYLCFGDGVRGTSRSEFSCGAEKRLRCFTREEAAFRLSIAAGSASAFSEHLATREKIEEVAKQVRIEKWGEL